MAMTPDTAQFLNQYWRVDHSRPVLGLSGE